VNGDFIIDVLNILSLSVIFIQESFQVLESDVHEVNKKIQLEDRTCVYCFSSAPDIGKVRLGQKVGVTNRDNSRTLSTPSEEDQARLKKLSSSKSTTPAVVE